MNYRRKTKDADLSRLSPETTRDLLAFNIRKQRIVDLCNAEFEDDAIEDTKSYSSFHRALDGHETYEGIVRALEDLQYSQQSNPRRYLPDDPGEDLAAWMAHFAKATWWHKTLQPDMSLATLNSWFSGRGKRDRPELREAVEEWWAQLLVAVDLAERRTAARWRDRELRKEQPDDLEPRPEVLTWDTFCQDLLGDGLSVDEVRERFLDETRLIDQHYDAPMIDLAEPQPLVVTDDVEGWRAIEFDELREAGFPRAASRTPPVFDPSPDFEDAQWGDRRDERCPKDLNWGLYNRSYRTKITRFWNAEKRIVDSTHEIVQVSDDGSDWRDANDREKQGWLSGFDHYIRALDACEDTDNLYTQELGEAKRRVRDLERMQTDCYVEGETEDIEAKLREAREDLDFRYFNTG